MVHVLPSMVLLGIGAGIAFNPVLLAAMGDVEPHESGLASGVVNTAFMMGGALGLAVLVAVSDAASDQPARRRCRPGRRPQRRPPRRLRGRCGRCALSAAAIGGLFLRPKPMVMPEGAPAAH